MAHSVPLKTSKVYKHLWTSPDSFTTTLLTLMLDMYGTECLDWSPITIHMELNDDLGVVVPSLNLDRALAGMVLVTTDNFYKNLPDFNDLCQTLSGHPIDHMTFAMADALDIAWGITEAVLISPPDEEEPFIEEIIGYIGSVVKSEGILDPPDILRLGQLKNVRDQISYDYSDDPDMFQSIWENEKSKTDDINNTIKERLRGLFVQLESLQLINGSTVDVTRRLKINLNSLSSI